MQSVFESAKFSKTLLFRHAGKKFACCRWNSTFNMESHTNNSIKRVQPMRKENRLDLRSGKINDKSGILGMRRAHHRPATCSGRRRFFVLPIATGWGTTWGVASHESRVLWQFRPQRPHSGLPSRAPRSRILVRDILYVRCQITRVVSLALYA